MVRKCPEPIKPNILAYAELRPFVSIYAGGRRASLNINCWAAPALTFPMTSSPHPVERRRVVYTGRVQGVGFRFTARQVAQSHAVTGFVRNLPNGNVELVAEGIPTDVDRFLAAIAGAMSGYIDAADVQTQTATGEFKSFGIAY